MDSALDPLPVPMVFDIETIRNREEGIHPSSDQTLLPLDGFLLMTLAIFW